MAVRTILQIGDPHLKAKNKSIKNLNSPKTKQVINDLIDTMHANELVGIAAPQIGENYGIFVTEPRKTETRTGDQIDELRIYINPVITFQSKTKTVIYEGCGCVAKGALFGPVLRPKEIEIQSYNMDKHKFSLRCDGLLARVIQHEYDHLNGIEFTERIDDYRKFYQMWKQKP